MKKTKKVKVLTKEDSLMKVVLDELSVKTSPIISEKKSFDFRDIFWNYPEFLVNSFKKLIPVSYILLFGLVALLIILFLNTSTFTQIIGGNQKKDTLVGGVVGTVNSLNPLYVTNNYIERSIDSLIFERFINIDSDGNPTPGIAKNWESKEDGLVYEFKIDEGHFWHDGSEVTVDDVVFTFDTAIKLSKEAGFDSVGIAFVDMEVTKLDENTVQFRVKEKNPVIFRALSIYIVPHKYLAEVEVSKMAFDVFTKSPIGSGKYSFVKMDSSAIYLIDNPYDEYEPHLKNIVFKMYSDWDTLEMAFRVGNLDAIGSWDRMITSYIEEYDNFVRNNLVIDDREKLIFFNIRKDSLKDKDIRIILTLLLNKEKLIEEYGVGGRILNGPLPETSWAYNKDVDYLTYDPTKAVEKLEKLGYKRNPDSGYFENQQGEILTFTISYLSILSNERLVTLLSDYYKEEGVFLKTERLDYTQITQEVISTRDFELLLYEVETSVDPDQYNLWHSLKANFPDLNLSGYNYGRVDILLEEGRQNMDKEVRKQKYYLFQKYLMADAPAIFLYNPIYEYITRDNLVGVDFDSISHSYERFHNIEEWYWK